MQSRFWLATLLLGSAVALATPPVAQTAKVTSPYGIPGQVPVEDVWTEFLASSNLDKASAAMQVTNRLFDDQGNLDPAACKTQQQAVRDALAEIPVSTALWLYGGRCAELSGDPVLAAQSEEALIPLLEFALKEREFARFVRPIRVLGENDAYAILDLLEEKVLYQFYEVPVTGRHMRLMVTLYDEKAKRESPIYFDFLDVFVQLARNEPDLAFPDGRQRFAQSLLENMKGSVPAEIAGDFWGALRMPDPAARAAKLIELGDKEGDYKLWIGLMCTMIEALACVEPGIEMLLPYAEANYADAYVALAAAYALGRGVERSDTAARDMLLAANQELGAPRAELGLQTVLKIMSGKSLLHPLVADGLRAAARNGDPAANLTVALAQGDWKTGVPATALPMLQIASRAGIANATGLIGRHHLQSGSADQGVRLLRQAAEAGDSEAAGTLGAAYAKGDKVPRDGEQAMYWLNLAAQDGDQAAMRMLAAEYRRQPGVDNEHRVDRWLSSATMLGDVTAATELARFLRTEPAGAREPRKRALMLFNALIDEHDSDTARVELAIWYLTAKNDMHTPEKAEPLLRAAAEGDAIEGRVVYVVYAMRGRLPGADLKQTRIWLEKGLKGNDVDTAVAFASTLMYAKPEFRDVPRALATLSRWWEEKKQPRALNELAWARCTSPSADIFDAAESARLGPALAAIESTAANPAWLDTVAACHAAAGKFDAAIDVQKAALATVVQRLGDEHPMAKGMHKRLQRYEAGERISEEPFPESGD